MAAEITKPAFYWNLTPSDARLKFKDKRLVFGDPEQIKLIQILEDAAKLSSEAGCPHCVGHGCTKCNYTGANQYAPHRVEIMEWHKIKDLL